MEFTCLSEGTGFYCPPCHIMDVCGFRILFDCPMDLSSLTLFSPAPMDLEVAAINHDDECTCSSEKNLELETTENKRRKVDKPLDADSLIRAEPRYRTIRNMSLWDATSVDVLLVSSPMGMLGLPFLTRKKNFAAKIYATEAAAKIGRLMMEELVAMHKEFRQFYGPEPGGPQWMKWENLELLPLELKQIALGTDGTDFSCWMPLYSAADVKDCVAKIQCLKYAEEACYNGTLIVKAFSSGLDIGSCNWNIASPKGSISYVSSSVSMSAIAMSFNYEVFQENDVIVYSDFSSCHASDKYDNDYDASGPVGSRFSNLSDDVDPEASFAKLNADDYLEEMEKFDFICSCAMDSVKAGGSVLIPIGQIAIILQLLEQLALGLKSENVKVPILVVSSIAEELMAYTNIIPEWLCEQRQERLYCGQPLFAHVEMLKDRRLHLFPAIHSLELLKIWQEPCIVFCPHWSLRFGPVIHLLRRWCRDENSLLIMEEGVDTNLALLPFKPITMKVLQCSFLSGIKAQQSQLLLKILQPRCVLFPEMLRWQDGPLESSFSFNYYSVNKKLHIPMVKEPEVDMAIKVVTKLRYAHLEQQDCSMARLKGELVVEQGRYGLFPENNVCSKTATRPVRHFGRMDLDVLLIALQKMGLNVTVEEPRGNSGKASLIHVSEPNKALLEVTESQTMISTSDENVASLISRTVSGILVRV